MSLLDAAEIVDIDVAEFSRIEDGKSAATEALFKVLAGFGREMLIMQRDDASDVLAAVGHTVNWYEVMERRYPSRERPVPAPLVLDCTTPTLFVDFDGTLHVGHALMDENGQITLDSGRPLLEFAPLLVELLEPYPAVEVVLTTSWLQTLPTEKVISYLPPELARRVVDTTRDRKARVSYMLNGSGRTDIITCYAFGKGLRNWLAIDDSVYGAYHFGREPGELVQNFVLLDSTRGIGDGDAQLRIREWLVDAHKDSNS